MKTHPKTSQLGVAIALTRFCNARCVMCPMHNQINSTIEHMDEKTFEKVIDIFKGLGRRYMAVHSMGECLAHPKFGEYVDRLRDEHFWVRVSTNASYMHMHMDTLLKIHYLKISLEGWDKESMLKYRGQKFDRVYENVKNFWTYSRSKITYPIYFNMHVYPSMTDENINEMVEIWGPWVDKIIVNFPHNSKLSHEHPFAPLDKDEWGDYHDMVVKEEPDSCGYVTNCAYTQPNGDVLACCNDYAGLLKYGNIHESEFLDIYYGERANSLRQEHECGRSEACGNCNFYYKFTDEVEQEYSRVRAMVEQHRTRILGGRVS